MTKNDMDAEARLLDQTNFERDAEGFATFQKLVENPPAITDSLLRSLTSQAPWDAGSAATGKITPKL